MAANTNLFPPRLPPPAAKRKLDSVGATWIISLRKDVPLPRISMDSFPATNPVAETTMNGFILRRGFQDPTPPSVVSKLFLQPGKYTVTALLFFDGSDLTDTQNTIDLRYNIVLAPELTLSDAVRYTDLNLGGVAPGSGALPGNFYFQIYKETCVTFTVQFTGTTQIAVDGTPSTPVADFVGSISLGADSVIQITRIG